MILICAECGKEFKTSDRRRKYCGKYCGISVANKKNPKRKPRAYRVTDDALAQAAQKVYSMAGLLRELNLKPAGGNYHNMKRKLQMLDIDTEHWTGQAWNREQKLKDWSDYKQSAAIKPHLIKVRGHACEICTLTEWLNNPITLEVHHVDGERTNNDITNLQLLCPNCHSYTDTWKGAKNKKVS
jgi:hypothetical protein